MPRFICLTVAMATLALSLSACQSLPSMTQASPSITPSLQHENFSLEGKIGVRSPAQSGSAFYTWLQQGEHFEIELSGILGVGKTQISGQKSGPVQLHSAKTGEISAQTPEELLFRATGWQAPITHLMTWVQARPATDTAQFNKDSAGRISQIIEQGWQVDFSYNAEATLPNRLILQQADHRITLLIQNR